MDHSIMKNDSNPPTGRVSQADVAKAVGVSASTVSRALKNDPRITENVRKKVLKAVQELGYRPDPAVSALANYRWQSSPRDFSGVVAWITVEETSQALRNRHPEYELYWQGATTCAERFGYHMEEFNIGATMSLSHLEKVLYARNVQGLLLPPEHHPFDDWKKLHAANFSIVRLSRTVHHLESHLVTTNQTADGLMASKQMNARGYQRIGFVGMKGEERLFYPGFAWGQHNQTDAEFIPPLFLSTIPEKSRAEALKTWIEAYQPDAILEDMVGIYDLLDQIGLRIPEDIAVATQNALRNPETAGILQNLEEVGRVGMLMLISLINDHDRGIPAIPRQIQVKGTWVDGRTLPPRT
jgi:DNA-binding LacI/PurR family transcriptional regulator